ncbi:MAG: efflux RND transporter permease subunit, partial [Oscillospiraceae bacterium]
VRDTVEILNASDLGVKMTVIDDASETIMDSVKTVADTLFMGIILSMIVLFVFFGNIKASLIVGTAMPVSLLVTLILMNLMGLSLNIISLGGLVIGVGMMVDNSIVVIESCFRRREASQQRSLKEAAIEGAELVTSSVIAGTITTVVVFLPIALLQGMSGQMFKQLGFTIIFSLTASLISALTLVPLLFVRLDPKEKTETWVNRTLVKVENSYGNILKKSFSHRKLVATFSVVLLIVSFALIPFINMELLPASDEGTVQIDVDTKPGLSLEESDKIATTLETMVSKHPDVDRYTVSAGDKCSVTAYLKGDRKMSTIEVVDQWRDETKNSVGYNVSISSSNMTSQMTGGGDVAINLQGNDLDILREASKTVEEVMRQNPGVIKVTSSLTSGNPQAEIKVDPMRANAVGLSPQQVVGLVYNMISGKEATTIRQDGQEYSVFVEYPQGKYETVSDLSGLMLSAGGYDIPLLDIATIEYSNSPQAIMKENSQYIVTVTAQPSTEAQYTAPQELKSAVDNTELPRGVTISEGRQQEQMMKEFTALGGAIAAAIFLVFMVMAMQFESPRFSALIMLCIPFSLIGSFGMLLLTRSTLSMPSMIGFLMLVGTVVNSGILFIDTANRYRETMDIETALIEAGRTRLRPILMTTLTTVLSMIPMGMGFGENGKLMQGMAVVIIGGLVASTILTLLLLPTFYIIVYPKGDDGKKKKKRKKLLGKSDKQDTEELTQAIEDFTVPNLSTDS